MKIYKPLKNTFLTQGFGKENTHASVMPIYKKYGMLGHNGWDWSAKSGQPIYWNCDIRGTVLKCYIDRNGGLLTTILTQDKDGDFKHLFGHQKEFKCQAGQTLETGDIIGLADNTGTSTGDHTHEGLKPVKMTNLGWRNSKPDNKYCGAIDPSPYFENIFVLDKMAQLKKQVSILKSMVEIYKKLIKLLKNV